MRRGAIRGGVFRHFLRPRASSSRSLSPINVHVRLRVFFLPPPPSSSLPRVRPPERCFACARAFGRHLCVVRCARARIARNLHRYTADSAVHVRYPVSNVSTSLATSCSVFCLRRLRNCISVDGLIWQIVIRKKFGGIFMPSEFSSVYGVHLDSQLFLVMRAHISLIYPYKCNEVCATAVYYNM